MNDTDFKNAKRIQESILTPLEKLWLPRIARKFPIWIKPDHLTIIGLLSMLLAGSSYALSSFWSPFLLIANIWIVLNWFGDSLDGTLARTRNKQRPRYGFYVDHIVDMFGVLFLIGGLILSNQISIFPAIASLVGFLMLSIHSYLETYVSGEFRLSAWKLGPTELRLLLIGLNFMVFFYPSVTLFGRERLIFDIAGFIIATLMILVLVILVIKTTIKLFKEERV